MDSELFDTGIGRTAHLVREASRDLAPTAVKVLVAGGYGVGKTTLVGTVSEILPLRTEELVTTAGNKQVTDAEAEETTVAMDFGRLTLGDGLILYLLGTPGQDGFWFLWDELASGALGAIVLADARQLDGCCPSIDYFERRGTPFAVAVNCFGEPRSHQPEAVRKALNLGPEVPLLLCDVRDRGSVMAVLVALVEHVLSAVGATTATVPQTAPSRARHGCR